MERLILERVRELVGHHGFLLVDRNPIRDVKLFGFRIVEAGHLIGEHVDHERIEWETFGDQAERFESLVVGVALFVVAVFLFLADEVVADFLLRAQTFFERLANWKVEQLAHLREHLVGGFDEVRVRSGGNWRRVQRLRLGERRAGCGAGGVRGDWRLRGWGGCLLRGKGHAEKRAGNYNQGQTGPPPHQALRGLERAHRISVSLSACRSGAAGSAFRFGARLLVCKT